MARQIWIASVCAVALMAGCSHSQPKEESAPAPSKHESAKREAAKESPKAETKAPSDKTKAVTAAIDAWAAAWSKRDVDGYLAAYAPDFKPEKGSRAKWEKQRRERVAGAKHIKVTIGNPQVTSSGKDRATARFTQIYESDKHSDSSDKKLELKNVDGKWLITRETSS